MDGRRRLSSSLDVGIHPSYTHITKPLHNTIPPQTPFTMSFVASARSFSPSPVLVCNYPVAIVDGNIVRRFLDRNSSARSRS